MRILGIMYLFVLFIIIIGILFIGLCIAFVDWVNPLDVYGGFINKIKSADPSELRLIILIGHVAFLVVGSAIGAETDPDDYSW